MDIELIIINIKLYNWELLKLYEFLFFIFLIVINQALYNYFR